MSIELSPDDKKTLCSLARESIEAGLAGRKPVFPSPSGALREHAGAFVTLHENGRLRGCIGRMESVRPLLETIAEMAHGAAFEDPRFEPLGPREKDSIAIEITVLSPLRKIYKAENVIVGKHGLYIVARGRAGVLLPQVAVEYGWTAPAFLNQVCLKAGLPPGTWKESDASLYVFEGIIFGETE